MCIEGKLKSILRSHHVLKSIIVAIPEGFGVGMFINLAREDINSLSIEVGIQMMLRTAQTLVREVVATHSTAQSLAQVPQDNCNRDRAVAPSGGKVINAIPEGAVAGRDNVNPYLVSESVDTPAGREIYVCCMVYKRGEKL